MILGIIAYNDGTPTLWAALHSKWSDCDWSVNDAGLKDDDGKYSGLIWSDDNSKTEPTAKQIDDEIAALKTEYDATAYQRTRAPLYPDIGDQLDDLYKKGAFSDDMAAKLKKVKDDNPKP